MKILFVTNTFEDVSNGPSKFANYLLEMNKMFHDVEIKILTENVSVGAKNHESEHVIRLDLQLNIFTKFWGFVYRMFPYYKACVRIRRSFAFDIVVFNNAITGIWSALTLDIPVLGMINDDNSLCVSKMNFDNSRTWLRHVIFHHLEKLACRFESGIIVNSKYLFDLVIKKYGAEDAKLHILHKGVRINSVPEFGTINSDFPIRILFVKSDYIRGGLFDLICALGMLKIYKFDLQIIGPPHSQKEKILEKNISSNINIIFVGLQNQLEVQNYMKASHLFVVPSRMEAFGVANLEALANGLAVISTNVGGIPEVLDGGNNGWMVDPGNPEILAQTIQYVIEHPEQRLQKQKNGFAFVKSHFSQTQVLNNFLNILNQYKS
ncbi:glycosyltransferase family 4 protein [Dyadobacter sp. CY345]|uniref:glycosyltransferase family 4 protein n=1 Tax=Dyadobacter sp. CY345 TaxID=2909335 RepID=UPI001F3924E2|nr:glycosyltransferase family 4 protein [Dyadobacter sp. CY345]MCF2446182.1 glycosyltransferase family 4 protein [Dyadobacter sp. CY345]